MSVVRNAVVCLECEQEIISYFKNDRVMCPCGQIGLEGGNSVQHVLVYRKGGAGFRSTSVFLGDDGKLIFAEHKEKEKG